MFLKIKIIIILMIKFKQILKIPIDSSAVDI